MARPNRSRRIFQEPHLKGFVPVGKELSDNPPVVLLLEEFEAIRLCDYELLDQTAAARFMNISRPTFTRIYGNARRKIGKVFAEAAHLVIEGGKVYMNAEWYRCGKCKAVFNQPVKEGDLKCPLCTSHEIRNLSL